MRRLLGLTALVALVLATPAGAASGALTVTKVDTGGFPAVRVTVETPGTGPAPDIQILENGRPAANVTMADPGAPAAVALVIDTSRSMSGAKIDDAIAAATEFARGLPTTTLVGVYGFGSEPYVAAPLSIDRTQVATAMGQMHTSTESGTALYGGIQQAAAGLAAASTTRRMMVVLSDGGSSNDSATLEQALAATETGQITAFTIGIATDPSTATTLKEFADQTGGSFSTAADSAALGDVYSRLAEQLSSTYVFTFQSIKPAGKQLELSVTADGLTAATQTIKAPGTYQP